MTILPENQELLEVASAGISALNKDERRIMTIVHGLGTPTASLIVLGIFAILVVAVAYTGIGMIVFALFAKK